MKNSFKLFFIVSVAFIFIFLNKDLDKDNNIKENMCSKENGCKVNDSTDSLDTSGVIKASSNLKDINLDKNELNKNNLEKKEIEKKGIKMFEYKAKNEIKPLGLMGISDDQINDHWKLYEGYVKQVNALNLELQKLAQDGKTGELIFADRRRRYGFEYNGMILHEYYFENLKNLSNVAAAESNADKKTSGLDLSPSKELVSCMEKTWGSFDKWKEDFIATGKTRGIGWAILYLDTKNMQLTNHFIAEHQDGVISGFEPILVMDVWEHAYMVDQSATDRAKYIDAFLSNVNWSVVNDRFKAFIK